MGEIERRQSTKKGTILNIATKKWISLAATYNTMHHTNQSITIMGDGLVSGVEQEQGFVEARQRKHEQEQDTGMDLHYVDIASITMRYKDR